MTFRGQRHREVAGDNKKAALKRLRELEDRLDRGKSATPKKVSFESLCDEYLHWAQVNLGARTQQERQIAIGAYIKSFFIGMVNDIDVRKIEAFKALRMGKKISAWTMNNDLKVLSCILKFGVENGYLEQIPKIRRVKIPKIPPAFLPPMRSARFSRPRAARLARCSNFSSSRESAKGNSATWNGAMSTWRIACSTSGQRRAGAPRPATR